jgi:hypothetical protein
MAWIIGAFALIVIAVIAFSILGFAIHLLFSPWLLVVVAIVAWVMFRTRRSRQ